MWHVLGAAVDLIHALAIVAWVAGLPLLFASSSRLRRFARAYAVYAITFIVLSVSSELVLHECFLTTLARTLYQHSPVGIPSYDWFTVRFAEAVFGLSPSHRSITRVSQVLILATAVGCLVRLRRGRARPSSEAHMTST